MKQTEQEILDVSLQKRLKGVNGPFTLSARMEVPIGQSVGIMGPSGSGKSSILRMLAGLMMPDQGWIRIGKNTWFDQSARINLKPQIRRPAYVMQEYGLSPNMSVRDNLTFAIGKKKNGTEIDHWLEKAGLQGLSDEKPLRLSGGQKQRLALVRALIVKPNLLLLDEPLAAQDQQTRLQWQQDLKSWTSSESQLTTVLVSHDPEELLRLTDMVFEIRNGQAMTLGHPSNLFPQSDGQLQAELIAIDTQKEEAEVLMGRQRLKLRLNHEWKTGQMVRFSPEEILKP